MHTRAVLFLALSFALGAIACGDKDGDSGDDHHDDGHSHGDGTDLHGDADEGASVYADTCAGCHGDDGEGIYAPAMHDVVPHHSMDDIVDVVTNGSGDMAPALSDEQMAADVATFCRETWAD